VTDPKVHHNRRQRKKLRLGEFREYGFSVSASCPPSWSADDRETAMLKLIEHIDSRDLGYGGGDSASGMDGYVTRAGRGSATEEDRSAVAEQMRALGFADVQTSPLEDAWNASDDEPSE
jgi:hypothetical protein